MSTEPNLINSNTNPLSLFEEWFEEAKKSEINDPNAMNLATISPDGKPNSRIVLLKSYNNRGFIFYTNSNSKKGRALENNTNVALNFHWKSLQRQVRIEGLIDKLNPEQSDEYYNSRHYMSRIGAWASDQSRPLKNREELEKKIEMYKEKYPDENKVPRPPHWGGFVVKPKKFEFWQDMPHRIHQRDIFELNNQEWVKQTLNP